MVDFIGVFKDLGMAQLVADNTPAHCDVLELNVKVLNGN